MTVLITGGAGFIGSHLCDAFLARGEEVHVIDNLSRGRPGRLAEGVVLEKNSVLDTSGLNARVTKVAPRLIYHLAAQVDVRASVAQPAADAAVNVIGTINVLEAARAVDARVVFSSTGGALYGKEAPVPSTESVAPEPESPYGISKFCAEQYIGMYNRLHETAHVVLRLANVYGPRQHPSDEAGVVSVFCAQAIKHKPLTIYGDGKQTRDYVYVGDCVAAFLAAAECGIAGTWNIGTGTEVSVLDLAATVSRITGNRAEPEFAPLRIGELPRSAIQSERAKQDLGWQPTVSLAEGAESVVRWLTAGAPDRGAIAPASLFTTTAGLARIHAADDLSRVPDDNRPVRHPAADDRPSADDAVTANDSSWKQDGERADEAVVPDEDARHLRPLLVRVHDLAAKGAQGPVDPRYGEIMSEDTYVRGNHHVVADRDQGRIGPINPCLPGDIPWSADQVVTALAEEGGI